MKKIDNVDEIKKIELDILLHIHDFCKKNGLLYFLAYGTLIGAIRHKGFIPWDDDIDIQMTRADYNWMIENYNKMNPNSRYKLISPDMCESRHPFVKFVDTHTVKIEKGLDYGDFTVGIDVDIFPLDGEPDEEYEYEKWYEKLKRIYTLHMYCSKDSKTNIKRRIIVPLIRFFTGGRERLMKTATKLHTKYPYAESKYVGVVESAFNSKKNRYKKINY